MYEMLSQSFVAIFAFGFKVYEYFDSRADNQQLTERSERVTDPTF